MYRKSTCRSARPVQSTQHEDPSHRAASRPPPGLGGGRNDHARRALGRQQRGVHAPARPPEPPRRRRVLRARHAAAASTVAQCDTATAVMARAPAPTLGRPVHARTTTVKLALGAGSSRRAAAGPVRVLRHGEERLKAALLAPMVTLVGCPAAGVAPVAGCARAGARGARGRPSVGRKGRRTGRVENRQIVRHCRVHPAVRRPSAVA